MQVSIQLFYMSCFPQPFDKIFMCSLQIDHCHSQSLSLSECFEHNFILLSIDWLCHRLPKKTFQASGHFYLYLFIYSFFLFIYLIIIIFLSLLLLLLLLLIIILLVSDIPFSGDFNKSAVR